MQHRKAQTVPFLSRSGERSKPLEHRIQAARFRTFLRTLATAVVHFWQRHSAGPTLLGRVHQDVFSLFLVINGERG